MDTVLQALQQRIQAAHERGQPLVIQGGGTRGFHGHPVEGDLLDVTPLSGISSYEPTELVVTARAGTALAELEAALAAQGQCLPFEPPRFGAASTVGGMVATGFSGPARASVGALRDHMLGLSLLNGRGELLSFGGQVMKNVAGYDVSRVVAGSLGVLGVICEVSLKVLPRPPAQATLRFELDQAAALKAVNTWAGKPLPLHASACWNGMLVVRLAGAAAAVEAATQQLGGERIPDEMAQGFWDGVRDQRDEFFLSAERALGSGAALWRLSVPATAPALNLSGEQLIEWHGAQRWLCTSTAAAAVREAARAVGGHATLWRGNDRSAGVFAPLDPATERIHRALKAAFDPAHILNRGRMYPWL